MNDLTTPTNDEPTLGIITALPKEFIAMQVLLEQPQEETRKGGRYTLGKIPLKHGGHRVVVLALLPIMGTSPAATRATLLLEHFLQVKQIIMVGIAGGVPHPMKADEHVRLGDIVVSSEYGIFQYDFVKKTRHETIYRSLPQPPHADLLLAARYLEADLIKGERPWNSFINQVTNQLHVTRPLKVTDVLFSSIEPEKVIDHPKDKKRKGNEPRIFIGPIASANTLLKDAVLRDELRDRFAVKAIEMEGSGVASASWSLSAGYLVVRGICDYCDDHKNDTWQEYAAIAAAAYTRALIASIPGTSGQKEENISQGPTKEQRAKEEKIDRDKRPRTVAPFPPIWNVPYSSHPLFADRKDLLQKLHEGFSASSPQAIILPQALSGPSGIGKTRYATEYAFYYRSEYDAVLWVNAASRDILFTQYVALAHELLLSEVNMQDQMHVRDAVNRWLTEHTDWLLIFDNADDITIVKDFISDEMRGHILLTSQARAMGQFARRIELAPMSLEDGALFLLRRTTILQWDELLEHANMIDRKDAQVVVNLIGGLPLALDQAGAYIEESMCGVSGYIDVYHTHAKELLNERGDVVTDHPKPVATTWSLAFERIDENKAAGALLRLCAFLAPDAIPEELLLKAREPFNDNGEQRLIVVDKNALNLTIKELIKSSLIQRDDKTKMFTIHRLIQDALKKYWMSSLTVPLWAKQAVLALYQTFPTDLSLSWQSYQRYLPHVFTCKGLIETYKLNFVEAAHLLERAGTYLALHTQYDAAEPLYQTAIAIYQTTLGKQDSTVIDCARRYATLLHEMGHTDKAKYYEHLVEETHHLNSQK